MEEKKYYEDCFTEVEDGKVNSEFNKTTINCLSSKNNKFSMDCEGNLVVNSIITREQNQATGLTFDQIYPVGSIYMSVNAANPSTLFGGTWVSWGNGKVPVGIDTTQLEFNAVEKTGGEKNHALTINEMPTHNHNVIKVANNRLTAWNTKQGNDAIISLEDLFSFNGTPDQNNFDTGYTGNTQPHNNLPPYITCYMWKRVA